MDQTIASKSGRVRFAAVGDILLTPPPGGISYQRGERLVSDEIRELFDECDLLFGNLECTLSAGDDLVPTEPRVFATERLVKTVKAAGFDIVTLANNHMFDGLDGGFQKLQNVLDEIELPNFGAGMKLAEATAPTIMEVNGVHLAFIGAVDHRSGPFQFATANRYGVAPLDVDRLAEQVRKLRAEVNHVIVSLHWGEERFLIPSPVQIEQAHMLAEAGASIVLGHHPHVVQGLELHYGSPIIYSLGNFIADDVYFSDGDVMQWNRTERTGCILVLELTADEVKIDCQIPTYDDGKTVDTDPSGFGEHRLHRATRALAHGVTIRNYRREHLWVKTVLPTLRHLHWSELKNIRPRHFRNALRILLKSRDVR